MSRDLTALLATAVAPERVQRDAPLAPFTTFKVGGPADLFVEPRSSSDRLIRKGDLKLFSLWEGADELRPDEARLQHEFKRQKRSFEDFLRSKFGRKPRTYPNLVQLPELRSKMSVGSAADVG